MKKLKKILLINWLYFSKEVIEVGDVNFLTGKNGAGRFCLVRPMRATSIWRPMSAHSARWTAICVPIWMRITRIPAEARTFRPILSVNLRTMWSTIVSCAA